MGAGAGPARSAAVLRANTSARLAAAYSFVARYGEKAGVTGTPAQWESKGVGDVFVRGDGAILISKARRRQQPLPLQLHCVDCVVHAGGRVRRR